VAWASSSQGGVFLGSQGERLPIDGPTDRKDAIQMVAFMLKELGEITL
jgi:hypothetical protein